MAVKPKVISLSQLGSNANFFKLIKSSTLDNRLGYFKLLLNTGGFVHLMVFNSSVKMIPFVRTADELFTTTALRESKANNFSVVINGPNYDMSIKNRVKTVTHSHLPASATIQQGYVVYKGKVIAGKKSDMYYIANTPTQTPKYKFGQGSAPTTAEAALGNMGPLIINKMPFTDKNIYVPSRPGAVSHGQPSKMNLPYLRMRSNKRFEQVNQMPKETGKAIIAHSRSQSLLLIVVQPDNNKGASMGDIRQLLFTLQLDSAVYLDGSDSVLLMINNDFIERPILLKDKATITGVGFKY